MGYFEDLVAWVVGVIITLISDIGLAGIFGLMTLESMCLPVPSEVVLPFSGALVAQGHVFLFRDPLLDVLMISVAGTLGCILGSTFAYYIGLKGGRPFVLRYGRYVLLNERHLDEAERWFKRYGDLAIFGSRLLPVVRTFISLPAGMAQVPLRRFVVLTTLGSFPWCLALSYLGYLLGEHWGEIEGYFRQIELLLVILGIGIIVWYLWRRWSNNRAKAGQ